MLWLLIWFIPGIVLCVLVRRREGKQRIYKYIPVLLFTPFAAFGFFIEQLAQKMMGSMDVLFRVLNGPHGFFEKLSDRFKFLKWEI